jgi:DNA-binding CsgD family transcriptional regulator
MPVNGAALKLGADMSRDRKPQAQFGMFGRGPEPHWSPAEAWWVGMLDTFDLMHCGAVLLDASGKLLGLNASAAALVGDALAISPDQLSATDQELRAAVKALLCGARDGAPRPGLNPVISLNGHNGRPLLMYAVRCSGQSDAESELSCPKTLIIIDQSEEVGPAEAVLKQTFGLTSAEARIAIGLCRGQELKEIAASHGVTESTVRSQLKSILSKTETHRQSELIALLARLSRVPSASLLGPATGHFRTLI